MGRSTHIQACEQPVHAVLAMVWGSTRGAQSTHYWERVAEENRRAGALRALGFHHSVLPSYDDELHRATIWPPAQAQTAISLLPIVSISLMRACTRRHSVRAQLFYSLDGATFSVQSTGCACTLKLTIPRMPKPRRFRSRFRVIGSKFISTS